MDGNGRYAQTRLRMDDELRNRSGSSSRDYFRLLHKKRLPAHMFGVDLDFVWVEKNPHMVIAGVDIKLIGDGITFTEVILYNEWIAQFAPLYLIYAKSRGAIAKGAFSIYRYESGNPGPEPPIVQKRLVKTVANWREFGEWQQALRDYVKGGGEL